MIDQTATFDVCLDFLDNWSDNGDYYGMTLYNSQKNTCGAKGLYPLVYWFWQLPIGLLLNNRNIQHFRQVIEKPLKTRGFALLSKYKDMLEVHLEAWILVY